MQRRVHIKVSGRVQGVSYRASARKQALLLGVVGWTRNLTDGRVEILAEGDSANIATFIDWCRKGPHWARVDELQVVEETFIGEFTSFDVRRDA